MEPNMLGIIIIIIIIVQSPRLTVVCIHALLCSFNVTACVNYGGRGLANTLGK